jgi:3D (Asp-Asp-Asp) domain-containing protein
MEWRNMNEASEAKKHKPWGQKMKLLIATYLFISSICSLVYVYESTTKYNKLVSLTEETTNTLNETQKKVEEQASVISDLQEQNTETQAKLDETTGKLGEATGKLEEAEKQRDLQKARADKAEADLKKKRASRAKSSAVSTAKVAGMSTFKATAYNYGTTTASGTRVQQGRTIAVDPRVIPLGTKVKIVSPTHPHLNGVYTAEDTGGAVKGNIIDIYMSSYDRAIEFGRRTIYVEILN